MRPFNSIHIRRRRRAGFTVTEMAVSMGIAAVIGLSVCSMFITSVRTWQQELRQNEMAMRSRDLVANLGLDVRVAGSIVYVGSTTNSSADEATYAALGTCAYTPTAPNGQSLSYPSTLPSYSPSGVPAADKLIVFQVPSIDGTSPIPSAYDYIAYGWNQSVGGAPGTLYRTVIPNTQSTRAAFYGMVPGGGGDYDTSLSFTFHIASTAPTSPSPLTTSYPGTTYDPFATSGSTVAPSGARLQDVDAITVTAVLSAASWNATPIPSCTLTACYKLRCWRQT